MLGFTLAPAAPIPALPAPPPRKSLGQRFRSWLASKAGDGLLLVLVKAPIGAAVVLFGCTYWLANQTIRGRFRHHLRPFWVACLAWYTAPWWAPLTWLGVAGALYLLPNPGRWLSAREQAGLADAACLLAAWEVLAPGLELPVRAVLFLEFTAAGLFPWWLSRAWRTEPEVPVLPDEWEERWEVEVSTSEKAGPLADTVLIHDPDAGRYRLRARPGAGGDAIAKADGLACSLLSRPRGTVTIAHDPEGDANDFLVAFTERNDATVIRYADGPSLTRTGTVTIADTADGRPVEVAVFTPAGAAHVVVLATNRYGKGVLMRNLAVELCLWDKAFVIVVDAKGDDDGGSGLPELRGYADVYAWRKSQWKAAIHFEHELFQARARRYSTARQAFWHPDKPVDGHCDPLIAAIKDELRNIKKSVVSRTELDMLEQLSSMGATYGIGQYLDTQKGDAESMFSTAFRNDVRGNGTTFAGRAGDAQAAGIATQDFGIDLSTLPNGKGWWRIKTTLTDVPAVPARVRMYPTRDELEYQAGIAAPFGTVDDWLSRTVEAKLHPEDAEIWERWRPEFEEAPAAVPEPAPEPVRETVEVASGVHVEAPARILHAVPTQPLPDTTPALDLIPKIVREGGVMTRGEIAEAAGIKPEYASDRLKKLKEMGVMTEARTADGRPGWRVVA
jgi:hypothetical protein